MSEFGMLTVSAHKVQEQLQHAADNQKISSDEYEEVLEVLDKAKGGSISIDATKIPMGLLKLLLTGNVLNANQRKVVYLATAGISGDAEEVLKSKVTTPKDFYTALLVLNNKGEQNGPNIETKIGERWYPARLNVEFNQGSAFFGPWVGMQVMAQICDVVWSERSYVEEDMFKDEEEKPIAHTVSDVLTKNNMRPLKTDMQAFMKKLRTASAINDKAGKVLSVNGPAVVVYSFGWFQSVTCEPFGTFAHPRKVISENEIERRENPYGRHNERQAPILPFVRVFSLDMKKYVYVDVDDAEEYPFDAKAMDRLVLPPSIDSLLRRIFAADTTKLFGDVIQGKHGGMVMLAAGESGVGKTLTAEVFAEVTKRPLYVLELGELGTDLKSVEANLQRIFVRATRWNAILLFDEADIFLAKRDADLERSAIVGVFLRLLDYYPGMLFLTTNRPDIIDPAFQSRISLQLNYPALDEGRRKQIWEIMLATAKVKVGDIDGIPALTLNGRNIRNIVRIITLLYPRGEDGFSHVTTEQIKEVCGFRPGAGAGA